MKTPDPFPGMRFARLFALAWICCAVPVDADTIKNPDGGTTTKEPVDFGRARGEDDNKPGEGVGDPEDFTRPFEGKGEQRTTRDKDGNVTKIEWAQGNAVRRAVFIEKEGSRIIVTEIDYGPDGVALGQGQTVFDNATGQPISTDWVNKKPNGETWTGAQTRLEDGKWVEYEWDPVSEKWVKRIGFGRGHVVSPPGNLDSLLKHRYGIGSGATQTVSSAIPTDKIKFDISGTGKTIGHVATMAIQNLTDRRVAFTVPAMILESRSGKNQNYGCPNGQKVALKPRQLVSVRIDGVCLNRNKPPVRYGVTGDLIIIDGNPTTPRDPGSKISATQAAQLIQVCSSKYDAAEKLQKDGALEGFPYKDKKKQLDILIQWSTWMDPLISEMTGSPAATKEDLKKVVYKQVEEKGPMTEDTKKKVDQGIDTIFEKVELTTSKAKDIEEAKPETTPTPAEIDA